MIKIPTKHEILDQLATILESRYFKSSRTLTTFLDFVVRMTVEDRAIEIKEYTIGLQILSRKESVHNQKDASVRIHAVRLRKILAKYYQEEGHEDRIIIDIPKGSYFARFRYADAVDNDFADSLHDHRLTKSEGCQTTPLVAVMPFITYSDNELAQVMVDGIGGQICAELARYDDLSVLSYYSSVMLETEKWDLKKLRDDYHVSHLVTGSINIYGTDLLISYELVDTENFKILWAETIEQRQHSRVNVDLGSIATRISSILGGYTGQIQLARYSVSDPFHYPGSGDIDPVYWYYHFQVRNTPDIYREAVSHLEKCVAAHPRYALAHALLGHLYSDGPIFGFEGVTDPIGRALFHTEKALQIDPHCQQACYTMGWIQIISGDKKAAEESLTKCLLINPSSSYFTEGVGLGMAFLGKWDISYELIQRGKLVNPIKRWWVQLAILLQQIHRKDYIAALHAAQQINSQAGIYYRIFEIAMHGYLGHKTETRKLSAEYMEEHSEAIHVVENSLKQLVTDKKVYEVLHTGLSHSGLLNQSLRAAMKAI